MAPYSQTSFRRRPEELEELFGRYRFRTIPVVDDQDKIVSVVREKDAFSTGDEIRLAR